MNADDGVSMKKSLIQQNRVRDIQTLAIEAHFWRVGLAGLV
jgi:hypothetical protein